MWDAELMTEQVLAIATLRALHTFLSPQYKLVLEPQRWWCCLWRTEALSENRTGDGLCQKFFFGQAEGAH